MPSVESETVEAKTKDLTIEDVMPYPISDKETEKEKCKICARSLKEHNYMDFFLHPSHVNTIRKFWDSLKLKHDKTEITLLKLATNTPKTVMSPKEILLKLIEIGYNPRMTTWIPQISAHYVPSEKLDYKHRSITVKLDSARVRYNGIALLWETDFLEHKRLASKEEKTVERALEHVVTEPLYTEFLETHALDAEIDYRFVQKEFHQIAARVNANLELTTEYMKDVPPLVQAGLITQEKSQESASNILSTLLQRRQRRDPRDYQDRRQPY